MKPLIIAEKPSAAQAIAEALGGFRRHKSHMESEEYLLSWAIGHLVSLCDAEDYNPHWKRWNLAQLPIFPEPFALKVAPETASQFQALAALADRCGSLVNACDAGREGELIFGYIYRLLGGGKPVQRLWLSSLTRAAIREAMGQLRAGSEFRPLYDAAECRSQGDWLVGINATRGFTCRFGELLPVGRVQTPTLALLVQRERQIAAFVPETFWEVRAEFGTAGGDRYAGKWFGPEGTRLASAEAASACVAAVSGGAGIVETYAEKPETERPPLLYDLTELQREANRRFGMTAAATLKAAQELYEHRLITYPRTDSRFLSRHVAMTLPALLRRLADQPVYERLVQQAQPTRVHPGNRRVVDDGKVTDHHAIIPTGEAPKGGGAAGKVYDLIVRRFLAQFLADARFKVTNVVTVVAGPDGQQHRFRTRARVMVEAGWRAVEAVPGVGDGAGGADGAGAADGAVTGLGAETVTPSSRRRPARRGSAAGRTEEEDEAVDHLPALAEGDAVAVISAAAAEKQTEPPRRYSEAALLSAMETAGKDMAEEELREAMKGRGLGTPATRAATIEKLKSSGYVVAQKRHLLPTAKGHRLVELAEQAGAQALLSADLTAAWEKRISDVHLAGEDPWRFMADIRALTAQLVAELRSSPAPTAAPPKRGRSQAALSILGVAPVQSPPQKSPPADAHRSAPATHRPPGNAHGAATATGTGESATAGPCPRCGQWVRRTSMAWVCQGKCGWQIFTRLCGRSLAEAEVVQLLRDRRTPILSGFVSKTGRPFSAALHLEGDELRWEFPQWGSKAGRTGRSKGQGKTRGQKGGGVARDGKER